MNILVSAACALLLLGSGASAQTFDDLKKDGNGGSTDNIVAHANKRGDYLVKFRCDDNLIQNYWFSLFNDRLYVSLTNREP